MCIRDRRRRARAERRGREGARPRGHAADGRGCAARASERAAVWHLPAHRPSAPCPASRRLLAVAEEEDDDKLARDVNRLLGEEHMDALGDILHLIDCEEQRELHAGLGRRGR